MTKYYVLNLDPGAPYEWDRCALRDPITAAHPDLAHLVAQAVGGQSGSYLVSINIEVEVLEQVSNAQARALPLVPAETAVRAQLAPRQELVA